MSLSHPHEADLAPAPTVTRLLRDPTNRAVVGLLAESETPLDVPDIQSRVLPDVPGRFLRDRLRSLADLGIVERATSTGASAGGAVWRLSAAGRDLHRIHAVITRIVVRAGAPKIAQSTPRRERAVEAALDALADPALLRVLDRLAAADAPLDPADLEEQCRPVTRRTLYRRLRILQDEGVVARLVTHEVPRRTHYALQDRWRPIAGVLLLANWWELRHGPQHESSFALSPLLHLVAPITRTAKDTAGTVRWIVGAPDAPYDRVTTLCEGGQLRMNGGEHALDHPRAVDAEIVATGTHWAAALVTDDRTHLTISGDATLADAAITSARSALLSYVR
jgi:DNA-binding HxlR family transcriptional regulator